VLGEDDEAAVYEERHIVLGAHIERAGERNLLHRRVGAEVGLQEVAGDAAELRRLFEDGAEHAVLELAVGVGPVGAIVVGIVSQKSATLSRNNKKMIFLLTRCIHCAILSNRQL